MLRTPEPKEQARLLAQLLKAEGLTLAHQKALNIVARLAGYRSWNVMDAALKTPSKTPDRPAAHAEQADRAVDPGFVASLVEAAESVVSQADNAGCSDDLTVTSASAVERLEELLQAFRRGEPPARNPRTYTVHGFGVGDVQSLRPDLSDDEAMQVLDAASQRFDASLGMNWDTLDANASLEFPPYGLAAIALLDDGREMAVTVNLANGSLYVGLPEYVTSLPFSQRVRLHPPEYGAKMARVTVGEGDWAQTFGISDRADEVLDGDNELLQELSEKVREAEAAGRIQRTALEWKRTG